MEKLFEVLPGVLAITFIFGGWVIYAVVNSIVTNHSKARIAEQNAVLKKEMLDKGFSADEIIRVLSAGTEGKAIENSEPVNVSNAMIEAGYTAENLSVVMTALDQTPGSVRSEVGQTVVQMIENGYTAEDIAKFIESRTASARMKEKLPDVIRVA